MKIILYIIYFCKFSGKNSNEGANWTIIVVVVVVVVVVIVIVVVVAVAVAVGVVVVVVVGAAAAAAAKSFRNISCNSEMCLEPCQISVMELFYENSLWLKA